MSDEYFYGVTLSSEKKSETWDPEAKAEYPRSNKLLLRQALLGADAKDGEVNVIQVEAMSMSESVKLPVAILKVGEARTVQLNVDFPDAPVTFTLTQGSGPVHLMGLHQLGALVEEFEDMEEMEEEMLDEEEGDDSQFKDDEKKRKSAAAKRKTNEDEDDEENSGEPKGKKAKISNNAKGKSPAAKKNANSKK